VTLAAGLSADNGAQAIAAAKPRDLTAPGMGTVMKTRYRQAFENANESCRWGFEEGQGS